MSVFKLEIFSKDVSLMNGICILKDISEIVTYHKTKNLKSKAFHFKLLKD
jgi:hypothetical protein